MTLNSFFEKIVCLTVQDDEWEQGRQEFERVGLANVERVHAVKEIGPHQSFSHSERNILLDFLFSDAQTLLHLEDDCQFRDTEHLESALSELPTDWDIVYLGANLILWGNGEPEPERYSEHLFRVKAAWTTHAIGYNKKCVETVLGKQQSFNEKMFDNGLSDILPELNAYVVSPMVAWQRPRYSLIWGRWDSYEEIFQRSEEKLK